MAEVLSKKERIALNFKFLYRTFLVGIQVFPPHLITVVSRSDAQLKAARIAGAHALPERGESLNDALLQGAQDAVARGATAILSLSSDLPYLEAADLRAMLEAPADVAIATDEAGLGTNALLLRPALAIPYRYGAGSLAAHRAAAEAAGLRVAVVERPGLARDVDIPADLDLLRIERPEFF
ncbi:2-phospho-L-lactate guanylyltransferase [Rhizorhabdus dicambivorans]|uniref:2-phospho-L-lactate guanylyltransferase n=1 Tax=Rhizorhabdus dicambivorans TaxID=1850238 RepID=UPI001EDD3F37|nr:2-phospho-L-lactate guanylyltransferase [Rhizorhabdus dicambivorans]